jgi:2-methylcitrate dehydratase PrpD
MSLHSKDLTLEEAAARFIHDFDRASIRAEALNAAQLILKDQLSIQIGVSQLPWSRNARSYVEHIRRPGEATVVADRVRMDAASAAFVNACYGHGFEYDDIHRASWGHPGCCVVPTALAVGEELNASLGDILDAIVVGYEVYTRIGMLAGESLLRRGWHPHAILANFGSAAIAARLWKLDLERSLHALAIASSHASGITEYSSTGGSVKRVHAGMGVRNGVASAGLARSGITGPRRFLTGNKGFYNTFVQMKIGPEAAVDFALDRKLQIEHPWLKPYCACGATHPFIDAMRQVISKPSDIERIELRIQSKTDSIVGSKNANNFAPRNIEELQFSLSVQIALALLGKGNGYRIHRDFLNGAVDLAPKSELLDLAGKVQMTVSKDLDVRFPGKLVADVTIIDKHGHRQSIFVEDSKGTPENPFSVAELDSKARELCEDVIGASRTDKLFHTILDFDQDAPVRSLTDLLQK